MIKLPYAAILVGIEGYSLRIGRRDLHLDRREESGWLGSLKIREAMSVQLVKLRRMMIF